MDRTSQEIARARLDGARRTARRAVWPLVAFSTVVNLLLLTMPLYMLQIYDRILPLRSGDTLLFLSILAGAALVVLGLLEALRSVIAGRAALRLETALGETALEAGLARSRGGTSDMAAVRDLSSVRAYLSSRAVMALLDAPFAPLFIAILVLIHPVLALLTAGGALLLFVLAVAGERLTARQVSDLAACQNAASAAAAAIGRNGDTVRAMGMQEGALRLWGREASAALRMQAVVDARTAWLGGLSRSLRMGLQVAVLGVGAVLVLRGQMTAGMIFAASIISGRALAPIDQIIGSWKQTGQARAAWSRLKRAILTTPFAAPGIEMPEPKGSIEANALTVAAPRCGDEGADRQRPIIVRNVSFRLEPGQVTVVVGHSGSGKSTIARCLVGALTPDAGTVRIDGAEVAHWKPSQIARTFGYLGQEAELLPGTVRDNICRFAEDVPDEAVWQAAKRAHVDGLINGLPQGYATRVGPGGMTLSGGQRQRIALARAFFGNPRILVLDEPNANLDEDGERALLQAVQGARRDGVTVVLVTQRPGAVQVADTILRMVEGKVDVHLPTPDFMALMRKAQGERVKARAQAGTGLRARPRGAGPFNRPAQSPQPASAQRRPVLAGEE